MLQSRVGEYVSPGARGEGVGSNWGAGVGPGPMGAGVVGDGGMVGLFV